MAGDNKARGQPGSSQAGHRPEEARSTPRQEEFCLVEADSSQQGAIAGIAAVRKALIHGPSGTGESQTITNLIASLVANGFGVRRWSLTHV